MKRFISFCMVMMLSVVCTVSVYAESLEDMPFDMNKAEYVTGTYKVELDNKGLDGSIQVFGEDLDTVRFTNLNSVVGSTSYMYIDVNDSNTYVISNVKLELIEEVDNGLSGVIERGYVNTFSS